MKKLKSKNVIVSALILLFVFVVTSITVLAAPNTQTWTGWFIDTDCVGANPNTHTQNCNLMPDCIKSGEGIYVYKQGKAYNTYNNSDFLPFDKSSQDLAVKLNQTLSDPNDHTKYLTKYANKIPTIQVTGYTVDSNIPDYAVEQGYKKAIHITSIKFYNISGVSSYEVTSPENVVLNEAGTATKSTDAINTTGTAVTATKSANAVNTPGISASTDKNASVTNSNDNGKLPKTGDPAYKKSNNTSKYSIFVIVIGIFGIGLLLYIFLVRRKTKGSN